MLSKDQLCLEAIDGILEYSSGFVSADDFNNDYKNIRYSNEFRYHWRNDRHII